MKFPNNTIQSLKFLVTKTHPLTPVVLGLDWLRTWNPRIDWTNLTFSFGQTTCSATIPLTIMDAKLSSKSSLNHANSTPKPPIPPQVQLVKATTLSRLERQGEFIGLLYIQPTNSPYDDETILVCSATTQLPPPKPEELVPHEYHDFLDVFSETLARELPPHHDYDH